MKATPEQVQALADAAWQVLDDMGKTGTACCGAAKAELRRAFEPFVDDDLMQGIMTFEEAVAICKEVGL